MAFMSKDFTRLLNSLVDQQIKASGRQTEWFNMSADERASYIAEVGERLLDMQQSTLSVLAAQHYQMQDNPVSTGDQLKTLQQRREQMNAIADTPATSAYKQQLDRDILLYSRQQTATSHYERTWLKALGVLSPEGAKRLEHKSLVASAQAKQDKLKGRIERLEQQLAIQVADSTFSQSYVTVFSELQAYKDVSARYASLLDAAPAQQAAGLAVLAKPPRSSDELPVNLSLLLMEERPGYIRMNVALVNPSADGRFKDFFLDHGKLVVPTDGVLNFSFGTAARSLAWQQQYRLKSEPPSRRSPTYAPIRSVLVKTAFVEQYFASHLVSESTLREGFKAQVLGNGRKLLLTGVDRKVPNQVGIQVSGQSPGTSVSREVPLGSALSELINQNADIASFQTIGLEDYRQHGYHPDRDGVFVNIHELERSVGFTERQYLLEMPQDGGYRAATPFALITVEGDKVSSSHLSQAQTDTLYQYNSAFFDKLEQLRNGGIKASRLFEGSSERASFVQQLGRLLERNHITPAGVLRPEHSRASLRDIKGNNLNKVLWEQAFAASAWHSADGDALLFDLAARLADDPALAKALDGGYVQSDIAQARLLLAPLYEPWQARAVDTENQRVAAANAAQHPGNPRIQLFDAVAVQRALDGKVLDLLLRGPAVLEPIDASLRPAVEQLLASEQGRSLRKQALFHALRPLADSLGKAAAPINAHAQLAPPGGADKVVINNRLNQPDPYLILNTHPEQAQAAATWLVEDDKYRSYNQFRPDPENVATRYMNDLDTPFVGGISGTTQTVSNALPELFGGALSVKQYWQFQMANAAFMIRNGYHSFFETLYVAARYEPQGADSIGQDMLQMFDRYRAEGHEQALQGELYDGVMARVLPIVNEGLPASEQFHPPRFTSIGPMPSLLGQAAKDLQLKAGLESLGSGFEPRQGSADIQQFAADPVQFAKTHALSAEALVKAGRLPAQGDVQLVKVAANLYELEYTEHGSNEIAAGGDSVPAYFLGYNGPNQANAAPAYVDIPKHAAAGSFLFTGTLSGCSLVVTSLDADTFRVYHDGRVNSSLLYDNVVMAVDYKDYQVAGTAEGLAAAYMQYLDGQWQLVFQRQEYQREGHTVWPKLRAGAEPLAIQTVDAQVQARNHSEFAAYREQVHQNLKKVAAQFGVASDGVADGVYSGGDFAPDHPAIAAWNRLREEVQAKVNADIQQVVDQRFELQDRRRTASDKGLIDQQIKQLNLTQDYYRAQYDPVLREAGSVEKTWLWQQIKASQGSAAVVRTDDSAIQGGGEERTSSIGERYAIAEAYQRGARGTAFNDGLRDFRQVKIPGVDDKMSSLEMKRLFLDGSLTPQQRGALSARISETAQAEYIDKVLRQTAVFSEDFHKAGSVFGQLAPQDFYLSLVGDRSGGRCYPLVRAMAVALASGGEAGVNSLVQKLFLASADPEAGSSTLLKNSLIRLHSNVDAVQASTEVGQFKLSEVVARLAASKGTAMFALNTQNHSMMVGSTQGAEGQRYYFYDPNVGIFAFDSTQALASAMQQHLVTRKLAAHYGSFGSQSQPAFNLVQIDTAKMAQVPVGNGLDVADLSRPQELAGVIGQRRQVEQAVGAQQRVSEDLRLGAALTTFDAEQWGARFEAASIRLAAEHQLDGHWIPIISTLEEPKEGGYRVQFINRDQPQLEPRWLATEDGTFVEFRRFVDEHMRVFNEHFTLEHGQIRPRAGVGEAPAVDGLNAGFAVQTLIQWFADKNRQEAAQGTLAPDLATALKIHSYLGLAQIGHGTLQDVAKVTELVRTALRGEAMAAQTSLRDFASTLGHTVNEGAGLLFGGAMVGLDAYELAHAENDVQKAVFGTQLAFDSASFVTGAAGVGAGLLGASTAAAALGGAGVILGGLAVGFTALAQAFGAVAEDAKAVGRYFDALDQAYKGNGYRYDADKQVLVPLAGAVVKRLDLRNNQIGFDSQYIYRTHHGSTGSGAINYFFWAGDFPRMIHDRDQAIEVRSGIGYGQDTKALEHGDSKALILPGTPKSYISYEYMILPGATTRHDTGFDVIRRLEEDRRFDYDFYIFPSEETIRRIRQEYVWTPVEVLLDSSDRQLIVPELPKELHGYLNYQVKGSGGRYLVGLNEGAQVELASEAGTVASRWIIDTSQLADQSISVAKDQLKVGGVVVKLDPAHNGQVLLVNAKGEVREVDFTSLSTQVVEEDASKWQVPGQRIEQHLSELAKAHQLHGQYVTVENYSHGGRNVGRAFYDVAKERMLFTDTQVEQARNARLGAVVGDHAYFVDAENAAAWRVEIATGKVDAQFAPSFNQSAGRISRFWQEGDAVYLARRYQLKEREAELNFRILGDRMELVGVVGDDALLQLSARSQQHGDTLKTLLQGYQEQATERATPVYSLGAPMLEPSAAALVTVFGLDDAKVAHRYWVRTSDGTLIKPNLAPPEGEQPAPDAQGQPRSAWPIPPDLVFAGSMLQPAGPEVFFFYSQQQKVVFRQEGAGQKVLDGSQPSALRLAMPALANVLELNGHLVAVTEDGRVARIEASGQLAYEAVNEHWLKGRATWWQDLASVNGSSATLAVFGAKTTDGKGALPVWYHNGQVVVASPALHGKSLQFLGFDDASASARLFEPESGKLYLQAPMSAEALATAFAANQVLEVSAQVPAATALLSEVPLRSAVQVDAGLRLTTAKGEVLLRNNAGEVQLVALDKGWQRERLGNLPQALAEVAGHWRAQGVLTLQGDGTQGWFDVASAQMFASNGIAAASDLRFIGVAAGSPNSAYVYSPAEQALYQVQPQGAQKLGHYGNVQRVGSSLLLQGGGVDGRQDELAPPLIAGVDSVVLHGGSADDTYRLSAQTWAHYRTVVIDNDDPGQALDRLIMPVADAKDILVSRQGDDVLLTDAGTGSALVLRQVLGSQAAAHGHLQIELQGDSAVISVEKLLQGFAQTGSRKGGLFELASRERPASPESNDLVALVDAEGPSLAKLSGAMAAFADTGGAREHLPQNRQATQALLAPPLT